MALSNANEIYAGLVQQLPSSERLRLAALILDNLVEAAPLLDYSEEWTEEDIQEFAAYTVRNADLGDE